MRTRLSPYTMFGARGIYSWFVNFNAPYMVEWYEEMCAGNWHAAIAHQERMHALMSASEVLYVGDNLHGFLGKAIAFCSPFLQMNNRTRRPYLPVREETIQQFRRIIEADFADMRWLG